MHYRFVAAARCQRTICIQPVLNDFSRQAGNRSQQLYAACTFAATVHLPLLAALS
jgi:hypothetical protein